ncbi:MAG: DUF3368 domain-containing protein [Fimbriimonadales bacterium]|nr:DUF3368 domain-containing protein [Fimbriimonadales bacterium]
MKEPVVLDSTCLISLGRIGLLDILSALFEPCLIPPAVAEETGLSYEWLQVQAPPDSPLLRLLRTVVDDGEAEAIALAAHTGFLLVIDDRRGRSWARRMQIPILGTIGILIRAKQQGKLNAVEPVLSRLKSAGFYLTPELEQEALRLADELGEGNSA